ncbi:hypothetical protein PI124_g11869 [Phytophthora idaei]|nr:hypothetical protein PI124_g11869 [Phytophthora idaei]
MAAAPACSTAMTFRDSPSTAQVSCSFSQIAMAPTVSSTATSTDTNPRCDQDCDPFVLSG